MNVSDWNFVFIGQFGFEKHIGNINRKHLPKSGCNHPRQLQYFVQQIGVVTELF